jgi:peptide/nickel transport system permease protein
LRPGNVVGGAILISVLGLWLFGLKADYAVVGDALHAPNLDPSAERWLGTDHTGRDVFKRLVMATQAFAIPGLKAALIASAIGVGLGALSGYLGGWAARLLGAAFSTVGAIPRLILALLCSAIFGAEPVVLAWATGVAYAPAIGEAIQGRIRSLKDQQFVLAARCHGLPHWRILGYHLLWLNCRKLVARQLARVFGFYVVLEATLSYLDPAHFSPRYPTWGNMVAFELTWPEGNDWAWIAPAIAIWLTVLGSNLIADYFKEAHRE